MFYDLHIHSCLSPCAEQEMTPNNICQMAKLKGLDILAVSDHNSCLQQPALSLVSKKIGISCIYGVEVQTKEEVHVLGYFQELNQAMRFQEFLDAHLPKIPNDPAYFGEESVCDEKDAVVQQESRLLLSSLDASIETCIQAIHQCCGKVVLAHVMGRENGILEQLGFIPKDCAFDGLEVTKEDQKDKVLKMHPWMDPTKIQWFINSDSHRLVDISEANHSISEKDWELFWRDAS